MIKILKSSEKKEIVRSLEANYGVSELPYLLLETGKYKIRGFSGDLNSDELMGVMKLARVEVIGMYLLNREKQGFRISLDGSHALKSQLTKQIIELNEEDAHAYMQGKEVEKEVLQGIVMAKSGPDFLGWALSSGKRLPNFFPKERRIKA